MGENFTILGYTLPQMRKAVFAFAGSFLFTLSSVAVGNEGHMHWYDWLTPLCAGLGLSSGVFAIKNADSEDDPS